MIDNGFFNVMRANQCMEIAAASYLQNELLVRHIFKFAQRVEFMRNEETDTQVLLVEYQDMAFAAPRGTQFSENWSTVDVLRNTKFLKRDWPTGGRVHTGYGDAVNSIVGPLYYWVDSQRGQGKKVIGTGHSMGGSEITGLASIINFDAVYSFGAPRFGNAEFNKHLATKQFYRIVHAQDIAPSYPHKWLGYEGTGERWQLSRDGLFSQINGWSKDFFHYPYLTGKEDHKPDNYLAATKKGHTDVE